MAVRSKEKTDVFMHALEKLKSELATLDQAKRKVWELYPTDIASHKSNRVCFMRVFRAPRADYEHAVQRWRHEDANFIEISDGVHKTSMSGARVGNLNAIVQRTKFTALKRCNGHWRSLSTSDKTAFLEENDLMYKPR